ncbi:MAG: hypothetical protein DPW16_01735 [Chloroflexi bacterium]|nr:hypothetical protein [Chloroflexota bacterium]
MNDLGARLKLKTRLPRTWSAFFERYGNFTSAQLAAIPPLLDGRNVMLCARTASGKTEAAVAPLIERHYFDDELQLLYVTPTRALTSDLYGRLWLPLDMLRITLAVKTHDLTTFDPKHPAQVLITTPEAVDSLLASHARVFIPLKAVILDELHLFDGTVRGDQLRVILNRIRQIKAYAYAQGETDHAHLQFVGLSATIADPVGTAARYFPDAVTISLPEKRKIHAELLALDGENADALRDYLNTFRAKGWKKALVFCNTRAEVEQYAAAVRPRSPFGNAVYVHYSNIAPKRRREIEERFAQDESAICFASSTLELGIDIGGIDTVIMIGTPGSSASFMQRMGRGNRRKGTIQIACFYRTPLEEQLFRVLLEHSELDEPSGNFHPAVAIQQIFSLIKQSPQGGIRINSIASLFAEMLSVQDLEAIIGQLVELQFLQMGKPDEWKAGERLNRLFDEQNRAQTDISIYSNIGSGASTIAIRNQHTDEVLANVQASWLYRDHLTLEGRSFQIHWQDQETIWITPSSVSKQTVKPIFLSGRQRLSHEIANGLALHLHLSPGDVFQAQAEDGWYLFHWLGDVYGSILLELLRYRYHAEETTHLGLCLRLPEPISILPRWSESQIADCIGDHYLHLETLLSLGAFHRYLPQVLRRRCLLEQINLPRLSRILNALTLVTESDQLAIDPFSLLG